MEMVQGGLLLMWVGVRLSLRSMMVCMLLLVVWLMTLANPPWLKLCLR